MSDVEISPVCRYCEFPFPGCHGFCKEATNPVPTANRCGTIWGNPASLSETRLRLELKNWASDSGDPESKFVYYGKMGKRQADAHFYSTTISSLSHTQQLLNTLYGDLQ